jgi:phospho-N-acetylmuramoyl-pentapeptide-transferase
MLLLLYDFLDWNLPAVFSYFSTRMMLAAATSLLFCIFLGPAFIRKLYAWKIGQSIRSEEECPLLAQLHGKKKETPTMGGILILCSMVLSLVLWMDLTNVFTFIFLVTTLTLGLLGASDDFLKLRYKNSKGLSPRRKLMVQLVLASALGLYLLCPSVSNAFLHAPTAKQNNTRFSTEQYMEQFYVPFFKDPVFRLPKILSFLLIIFVITGTSNAVNLTDGLDGLAAGCLVMVSLVLGLVAFLSNNVDLSRYLNILYIEGSGEIGVYLFALAGACLGFLWYNGYPAQMFMGDTGSLALGGILGIAAILLRRELLLALCGTMFVVEALSVMIQVMSYRTRNKKRVFLCAPLHHHFEYKGWPETKVVIRFWIISLLFAILSVASLKFQ